MATGTQYGDVLSNDRNRTVDIIDALGGDDSIAVEHYNMPGMWTVTVDGGDGFDTLHVYPLPFISDLTPTSAILMDSVNPPNTGTMTLSYAQVEKLVVSAVAYSVGGAFASWVTGDTIDEIHVLGTLQGAAIAVATGGGDDKVYLRAVGQFSTVFAGAGNDLVDLSLALTVPVNAYGGDGDDRLIGSAGANHLEGGNGRDTLEGGSGDDILVGGVGGDMLYGGAGSDVFLYTSAQDSAGGIGIDQIVNFERGVDKIDLSALGASRWIGTAAFSGTPGEVQGTMVGIRIDLNGDAVADMTIIAPIPFGTYSLTAADFIF